MAEMDRRDFLCGTVLTAAGASGPRRAVAARSPHRPTSNVLKGFIVSDAHFGWDHEQQPAPDEQREMVRRIMERFGDLDVFIDTGDAHHSGADDEARGLWTDIIAGGCGTLPFYYVAGNHEIVPLYGLDPEWRCNLLGSLSCRPYYSFDIKGIHFVSLPEMKRAVYVTRETMEWFKLDLEVHKDQTTIILSHNNILGTTTPFGEYGYRGLVNSKPIEALLNRYPNVIAWMNGHNHTYEVMEKDNRLNVSNGRIGGFIPPEKWGKVGQGHLGGIYFEVTASALNVRCYSATKEKFLDELGDTHLQASVAVTTTLNPKSAPRYCHGVGGMRDGQRMPIYHHHAVGARPGELFMTGTDEASFNDDPEFAFYMKREHPHLGPHHLLMGSSVQLNAGWGEMWVKNTVYEWLDPGLRLLKRKSAEDVARLTIPLNHHGKGTSYRCAPGRKYRAVLDLESKTGGQELSLAFWMHDQNHQRRATVAGPKWTLTKGRKQYEAEVEIPDLKDFECIYNNPTSDRMVHLMVMTEFRKMGTDVTMHAFELSLAKADGTTVDPSLMVDGRRVGRRGELKSGEVIRLDMPAPRKHRTLIEPRVKGNQRVTWLVRHTAPDWQVRNAAVADRGDHLQIGPMRNTFSKRREVVIVPMTPIDEPFVHRVRNADAIDVYPLGRGNDRLKIEVQKASGQCEVEIVNAPKPRDVKGAKSIKYQDGRLLLRAMAGDVVEIDFG